MKIHNKFMGFFIVVLTLMCAVTIIIYKNSQGSVEQYDQILQRFLILNEIAQSTDEINREFREYLLVGSDDNLTDFNDYRHDILESQQQFNAVMSPDYDSSLSKNYYHMLSYFIDRMEQAIETQGHNESEHFLYREEAEKVSEWLNGTTLRLINQELEDYHLLHADTLQQNQTNLSFAVSAAMVLFLISLLFTYFMSKKILSPVRHLALQANELATGNFNVRDVDVTNDEVGVLSQTFNQMKRNVAQLIEEMKQRAKLERQLKEQEIKNIETDRLLHEMELRSLQNQMNPHFLFNTLNIVSKMAYIEGAEKSSELTVSISKLLRYNLKHLNDDVTIADELEHVQEYIDIQQTRFSERVNVSVQTNTRYLNVPLPLLTIQPLVENAFIHGIDGKEENGKISIHIYDKLENVIIDITDNGPGIDESTLEKIKAQSQTSQSEGAKGHLTGIGLVNVRKRLAILYGEQGRMRILSSESGTTIRLVLPQHNILPKEERTYA